MKCAYLARADVRRAPYLCSFKHMGKPCPMPSVCGEHGMICMLCKEECCDQHFMPHMESFHYAEMQQMREADPESWQNIMDVPRQSPDDNFTGEDPPNPPNSKHHTSSKESTHKSTPKDQSQRPHGEKSAKPSDGSKGVGKENQSNANGK
eukprot:3769263-Karenia_brevis.AAC.1